MLLKDKVAIITGGASGIGRGIAIKFAEEGGSVVISDITEPEGKKTAAEVSQKGGNGLFVRCDVTSSRQVQEMVSQVIRKFGRIDILVNNAGIGGPSALLHELVPADWDAIFHTNLRGVYYMIRSVVPLMIATGAGHIINISSLAGKNPLPRGAAYSASKWGLNGLSYGVAEELRGQNIRVSVICPGSVDTDFSPRRGGKDTRKMLKPDDVAQAVAMLVTQEPQSFISEILLRPTQKP